MRLRPTLGVLALRHRYKNNYISPTELETILLRHPSVSDCIVYGVPDETCQELVAAVVVLTPGHEEMTDEEDLNEYFDEHVPDHKRLRGGIIFREHIPRSHSLFRPPHR